MKSKLWRLGNADAFLHGHENSFVTIFSSNTSTNLPLCPDSTMSVVPITWVFWMLGLRLPWFTRIVACSAALAVSPAVAQEPGPDLAPTTVPVAVTATAEIPCEQRPFSVMITVRNVKSNEGIITVDLHDDPDRWLKKGGRIDRVRVPAVEGETKICVPVERAGTYAFALYHDEDHNLKLNKNWIGLPSEPFSVSNDAPIRMGPPSYKDASFQVTGPLAEETVNLSDY